MKCGKETENGQVFCDSCLEVMEQYPVKPDTVVQLPPQRNLLTEKKPSKKKELSPKEMLRKQSKLVKRYQGICLLLLLLLLGAVAALCFVLYSHTEFFHFIPFLP